MENKAEQLHHRLCRIIQGGVALKTELHGLVVDGDMMQTGFQRLPQAICSLTNKQMDFASLYSY